MPYRCEKSGLCVYGISKAVNSAVFKTSDAHSNGTGDFLHVVNLEWLDRGTIDDGAGDDVKQGAVGLTHDCLPYQQPC